jgi:hypothetical protein
MRLRRVKKSVCEQAASGNAEVAIGAARMSYVVDVKDRSNGASLETFPLTLPDEEVRDWWAGFCSGPVMDLPTADEVAIEYAAQYSGGGSVAVIHRDSQGRLIDSGFFAREIR